MLLIFSPLLFLIISTRNVFTSGTNLEPEVILKWTHLNFTFESPDQYEEYINDKKYIPENNLLTGIRTYPHNGMYYFSLNKFRNGTPVTLVSLPENASTENPLLTPYPSWDANVGADCSTLQNVRAIEIDIINGLLYVLDGIRSSTIDTHGCPAKLVFLDLNDNGNVVHSYSFPDHIAPANATYLSEMALAVEDGYVFISASDNDSPGIVVYSIDDDTSWKLFDNHSMLALSDAPTFEVNGDHVSLLEGTAVFGISLSPATESSDERLLYYTSANGENIYTVPIKYITDSRYYDDSDEWKQHISVAGVKTCVPNNDMEMDVNNDLWCTCIGSQSLLLLADGDNKTSTVYRNEDTFTWPTAISIDDTGYMYVTSSKYAYKVYFINEYDVPDTDNDDNAYTVTRFRINAESYKHSEER